MTIRAERITPAFQCFVVVIYLPEYLYPAYRERAKVMLAVRIVVFVKLREVSNPYEDLVYVFVNLPF